MALSQVLTMGFIATDPLNKLGYMNLVDASIDPLVLMLHDVSKTVGYPRPGGTPSVPVNGLVIPNLVTGAPSATVVAGGSAMTYASGALNFTGAAGYRIQCGVTADYQLVTLGNPDFVVWEYIKITAASLNSPMFIGRSGSVPTPGQFSFILHGGGNGKGLTALFSNGTSTEALSMTGTPLTNYTAAVGQVVQIGIAKEGGRLKIYWNGQLVITHPTDFLAPFFNAPYPITLGEGGGGVPFLGKIYRWGMRKLDSSKTAAQFLATDWANNEARIKAIA